MGKTIVPPSNLPEKVRAATEAKTKVASKGDVIIPEVVVELKDRPGATEMLNKFRDMSAKTNRHGSWEAMVDYHKSHLDKFYKTALLERWELGLDLLDVRKGSVYGENTLEQFVADMGDECFPIKMAYACALFAERFSPEDLVEIATSEHVNWGVVNKVMYVKDHDKRMDIVRQLASGELKPSKLEEHIKLLKSKAAAETVDTPPAPPGEDGEPAAKGKADPRRNYIKNMSKLSNLAEMVAAIVDPCLKDISDMTLIADDEVRYNSTLDAVYDVREKCEKAAEALDLLIEAATKVA